MLCKQYPEMKHLRMRTFQRKNKVSRPKDQDKRFYFISPAMKTNVNIIFFMTKRNFFRVFCKHTLRSEVWRPFLSSTNWKTTDNHPCRKFMEYSSGTSTGRFRASKEISLAITTLSSTV